MPDPFGPFASPQRPAPHVELCEWDPEHSKPGYTGQGVHIGCQNPATWSIGKYPNWHLCDSCAALPEFKRYRKRERLRKDDDGHQ